jgi:ribosomal protein L37AE/L43A
MSRTRTILIAGLYGNVSRRRWVMATREIETPEPPEKPMTTTPCPTCTYPARESDFHVVECGRCQAIAHEPCFWPALPIKKWLIYTRSREESVPPSTFDRGFICAACRQVEGLGKGDG